MFSKWKAAITRKFEANGIKPRGIELYAAIFTLAIYFCICNFMLVYPWRNIMVDAGIITYLIYFKLFLDSL